MVPGLVRTAFDADIAGFDLNEFNSIRDKVFNEQDLGSAKLWGDKLQHLQKKCFEERNAASCQLVHKEMSGASELFNNLSNVTQMTASQAKHVAEQIIKSSTGEEAKAAGADEALLGVSAFMTGDHAAKGGSAAGDVEKERLGVRGTTEGDRFL